MSVTAKDILKSELQEGEELLWSHLISHGTGTVLPTYVSGIWKFAQPIIFTLYLFSLLYWVKKIPSEELGDMLKQQLSIWLACGIILYLFTKTVIGKRLQAGIERPVFRNGIITDRRILLFNHLETRQEISIDEFKEAGLDYENGGHALRIGTYSEDKPSVLIGIADFKTALNIIKSQFLKGKPS